RYISPASSSSSSGRSAGQRGCRLWPALLAAGGGQHPDQRPERDARIQRVPTPCGLHEPIGVLLEHQPFSPEPLTGPPYRVDVGLVAPIALLDRRPGVAIRSPFRPRAGEGHEAAGIPELLAFGVTGLAQRPAIV